MNILMVLESPFPPDERVGNEIEVLLKSGFQITLACAKRVGEPDTEQKGSLIIRRIHISKFIYKSGALALELPFYFHFWHFNLSQILNNVKFDAIHLHDLPLASVCKSLALKFKLPLVSDYHENRPEIMKMYGHVREFPGNLLISMNRWARYQVKFSGMADRLILVTEEARDYYIENYGVDRDKIVVLPNFIEPGRFKKLIPVIKKEHGQKNFTVVYFGDTGLRRGTMTIIESAEKLKDHDIEFLIIGTSREHHLLEKKAHEDNLKNVTFTGWTEPSEAFKLISNSDAGICPFLRNIHHDTTYANKMFQYMALGKPVLVSDCTAQANFVNRENCGLVFEAGNSDDLSEKITKLASLPEYERLAKNAVDCVYDKYNWGNYGGRLVELYSGLKVK